MAVVLVDAENVRRSLWPNLAAEELVERCAAWGAREGHELVVVFDGRGPAGAVSAGGSADDWIARRAAELARAGTAFRVVTSDRGLRARVEGAERVVGGGSFARELLA
jgi:predicted RNA-binding protein with PIN domain